MFSGKCYGSTVEKMVDEATVENPLKKFQLKIINYDFEYKEQMDLNKKNLRTLEEIFENPVELIEYEGGNQQYKLRYKTNCELHLVLDDKSNEWKLIRSKNGNTVAKTNSINNEISP